MDRKLSPVLATKNGRSEVVKAVPRGQSRAKYLPRTFCINVYLIPTSIEDLEFDSPT